MSLKLITEHHKQVKLNIIVHLNYFTRQLFQVVIPKVRI